MEFTNRELELMNIGMERMKKEYIDKLQNNDNLELEYVDIIGTIAQILIKIKDEKDIRYSR